ncbi:hypothetical protein N7478_013158 [Penicillium angulare]|uniref:uncharacterized protein n=1 Tax=Penicillium angulare TaxID=116970 RepID=UPI00253F8A74|nr:uncharacterized protein N7478_013158 [Penicillium angulare]KAJ5257054.1 hypothetical protein N7478_013158 [Penicillium angulare]
MISLLAFTLLLSQTKGQKDDLLIHYDITIPGSTPEDALAVPSNFFGFGFESGLFPHYDNDFSENMVNAIGSRMSEPIVLRLGGSSGDHLTLVDNQTEPSLCDHEKWPICDSNSYFTIGPSYFNTLKRFTEAKVTLQAPMNDSTLENSMTFLRNAWEAIGQDRVEAIALGNEPNYYDFEQWTAAEYVNRSIAIEDAVIADFELLDPRIFQIGEIPSEVIQGIFPLFTMQQVLEDPIIPNNRNKYASGHLYQLDLIGQQPGADWYTTDIMQKGLLSHDFTTKILEGYARDAAFLKEQNYSFPLVISEMGCAIGNSPPDFAGGFGAAVSAVDINLKAMTIGVKQITNTQEPTATHSWWVPDNSGPQTTGPSVQGVFPAAAFITDFVGRNESLGRISQVLGEDLFSAYVMHDLVSNKPSRVALLNLKEWHSNSTGDNRNNTRGNVTVSLNVGYVAQSVVVQRLRSDYGSFALGFDNGGPEQNTSWAGEQWSYRVNEGKGHFENGLEKKTLSVKNGKVDVVIPDTEVVMVSLK